jgi:hypothetical protein
MLIYAVAMISFINQSFIYSCTSSRLNLPLQWQPDYQLRCGKVVLHVIGCSGQPFREDGASALGNASRELVNAHHSTFHLNMVVIKKGLGHPG